MVDETAIIAAALVECLNASTRPPALAPLKYPRRELRPKVNADGSITVTLARRGFEYKHRGPRPKTPPPVNLAAIRAAINAALLEDGYTVTTMEDCGAYISITFQEEKHGKN